MNLKEFTPWPPLLEDRQTMADLDDTVLRAFRAVGANDGLSLRLQATGGAQYEVPLPVPAVLQYRAAVAIVMSQGHTLRDIGELEFS